MIDIEEGHERAVADGARAVMIPKCDDGEAVTARSIVGDGVSLVRACRSTKYRTSLPLPVVIVLLTPFSEMKSSPVPPFTVVLAPLM